jgi:RsiW-degrading membrane proteinase PrsW (M82 family)
MSGGYIPNYSGQPNYPSQPAVPPPHYTFGSLLPFRHWAKDPSLRSWPVLLLIALVVVPPIGVVLLNQPSTSNLDTAGWIYAYYFAIAWLLLLGVIVRPQHVSRVMLATVAVIGIVVEVPIALALETRLHSSNGNLFTSIVTIGIPEELSKAVPIIVVAWIWRRSWLEQTPRDYLFLGAVSGLVFGATEAERYYSLNLGSLHGQVNGMILQDITIQYIWRFLTDPISHACWAGITGYFIGLAVTGTKRHWAVGFVGIAIAAILHGFNDWNPINSHSLWVVEIFVSVVLFLGYARAGAYTPQTMPEAGLVPQPGGPWIPAAAGPVQQAPPPVPQPGAPYPPVPGYPQAPPVPGGYQVPPVPGYQQAPPVPSGHPQSPPSGGDWWGGPGAPPRPAGAPQPQPAWAHSAPAPPQPVYAASERPTLTRPRQAVKPWWEQ